MLKKIVSYVVYGDSRWLAPLVNEQIQAIEKFLPEYKTRFYVAENFYALDSLYKLPCEVICMPAVSEMDVYSNKYIWNKDHFAKLWPFTDTNDPTLERLVIRNIENKLLSQEISAIQKWEKTKDLAMVVRSPHEATSIGFAGTLFDNIQSYITDFKKMYYKYDQPPIYSDQIFFDKVLWPFVKNDIFTREYK